MFAGAIFCEETKLLPADEDGREVGVEERGCWAIAVTAVKQYGSDQPRRYAKIVLLFGVQSAYQEDGLDRLFGQHADVSQWRQRSS